MQNNTDVENGVYLAKPLWWQLGGLYRNCKMVSSTMQSDFDGSLFLTNNILHNIDGQQIEHL